MTTVRREIGDKAAAKWDQARIAELVVSEFKRLVGPLVLRKVDCELNGKMEELAEVMINDNWLHRNRKRGSRSNGDNTFGSASFPRIDCNSGRGSLGRI